MPLVFSYGSLRAPEMQRATFGRAPGGESDALPGFELHRRPVEDARGSIATVLPSPRPGAAVAGVVLELTPAELALADGYEAPDGYRRIAVTLASGRRGWVFLELRSERSRIVFPGSPWPDGHALRSAAWRARLREGRLRFHLDVRTQEYDSEAPAVAAGNDDWTSPVVWSNYHRCTLSSDRWHEGGFDVDPGVVEAPEWLDGGIFIVDDPPPASPDDNAFYIYLLGHDACAHHRITFHRIAESDRFLIDWRGRIALAYAGDLAYRHAFHAVLHDLPMPRP